MSHATMDIDAMLMQTDERARRVARQKLLDNANDPVVKDFFDAEARLQMHKERVMRQMEAVNKVMNVAERDVSQLVTAKWVHQTGKFEDKLNASALHLGPALTSVTADARVFECIRMLLGGRPEFVDDVTFIAQMSTFAHPTETIDSACVSLEKLLTDTYATAHELAACVNPQHAAKLASMVGNARPVFASMAQMIQTVHKGCIGTRQDIEQLQGTIEVLKQHQQKAVRIGRELMRENETLRRQLFKSTVGSGGTTAAADEDPNSAAGILNDTAGARQTQQSTKIVVLVQVEGCLQLKFKSPFMVSEALLVVQSIIESLTIKHKGSRVNYNPLYETRELFDRATNRRFAPESFALSFNSAGAAVLFASELHEQLLAGKWPKEMSAEEHFRERFPTVTVDDVGQETVLWAGLSVRAAVHTGIPFVSYPLAEAATASAGAAGTDGGAAMAQLSMIPFFGGLAMEKAMLLMQKARAGETLVTADAMKLFDAERFSDTTLSRTISTVAREVEGIQVGFDAEERIFSAVPRSIELRVTPEPSPFAYRALGNSVFPSSAFWRQIDQIEEYQPSDFEEEKSNFAAAAMLPHEYEARIEELEADARKLNAKIAYLEENGQRLVADALQYNDDRKAAVQRAERAEAKHARYKALMERRVPTMMRHVEARALTEHDTALQVAQRLQEADAEIEQLKESVAEAVSRIPDPVDTEEGECNTEEPYPNVKEIIEKVKHNIQANAAERRATMNCEACTSYSSQLDDMAGFLGKCSETFKDALTGNAAAAEVIRTFNVHVAQLLFAADVRAGSMADLTTQQVEEQAVELADVNLAVYDKLCDGATKPDAFVHRPELRDAVVHAAGITRTVCRFAIGKSIGNRMKNTSENYADELEFLMAQNEKLERRVVELHGARKEDLDKHRSAIAKLQGDSATDIKSAESRHEDLDLRVKLLSMKLKETSERAQAFFLETCELMDQLEATKSTADRESHSNTRIKASFEQLKATYALGSESTEAERVLRESNQKLARAVHALETRVKAREAELKLQRQTQEELKAMKVDELELARAAGATAALEEAEEELDDRVADAERRARRTAAEARAEDAQKHAEDANKAEERRRRDERRREELRAQREALDREEWKKKELERLVEEEVERRLEVARWGNRGDGGSATGTPGAGGHGGVMDVLSMPKPRRRRPTGQAVASGTDGAAGAGNDAEFSDDDDLCETCERSTQMTPHTSPAASPVAPQAPLPPSLAALVTEATPQVDLPPSMLLPGEPRASSARTFLCTGCSKKYMLRSAGTSARPGATGGTSAGGEGYAWAENAEAQTSRGHSPVDVSPAPPSAPTGLETLPAEVTAVVREVDDHTGTSATCSTQTAVSLRPGAAVYPVAEVATLTETIIGYTEDGTPVSVSVEQLLTEKDQNRRPLMLRAVAVGEGFLVLTADAASHMEEAWLMDVATQCDPPTEGIPEAPATPTAAGLSRTGTGSSTSLLRKGRASGASTPTGAAARRTATPNRVSSGSRRVEQHPPVASPPAVPLNLPAAAAAAAAAAPPTEPIATRSITTTTSGLAPPSATAASQAAVRSSSVPVQANIKRAVTVAESQTLQRAQKDFGATATPETLGRRVAAIALQCELLTDRMAADAQQASLGDLMGKQRGRLQNTSPTGFTAMSSSNRKLAPVRPVRVQEDDQEALLRRLRESAPVVSDPTAYSALASDGKAPEPFKRKPLAAAAGHAHDAAPITTGPSKSSNPSDGDIYRPHPKHAIERRGHELAVPLAQSGMPAIPAAIAARLMEGARRDVTGPHPQSGHRHGGSGGYSGVVGASGGSPRGPASPTSNREMEFAEPGVAPWTVAQRPDLERRSPGRRDAEDEDEVDLLSKFGLAHRDEVSLRAVHTKRHANGPAAKYDIKKKAPVNLIIGKPTRAATPDVAVAGQHARAAAAGQRSTPVLDAGRPRRGPLPLTPQPVGAVSVPGSRTGSAGAKQQLQRLSESGQ